MTTSSIAQRSGETPISFAPETTILRKAIDSDNWPITWDDDDEQYTAYNPLLKRISACGRLQLQGRLGYL
jgi:hypothetical protein